MLRIELAEETNDEPQKTKSIPPNPAKGIFVDLQVINYWRLSVIPCLEQKPHEPCKLPSKDNQTYVNTPHMMVWHKQWKTKKNNGNRNKSSRRWTSHTTTAGTKKRYAENKVICRVTVNICCQNCLHGVRIVVRAVPWNICVDDFKLTTRLWMLHEWYLRRLCNNACAPRFQTPMPTYWVFEEAMTFKADQESMTPT